VNQSNIVNLKISDNLICTSVAPIHKSSSFKSEMISQALMWDKIDILKKEDSWNYVILDDKYRGWIHDSYIVSAKVHIDFFKHKSVSYIYIASRYQTVVDRLGRIVSVLSFGTRVPVLNNKDDSKNLNILLADGSRGIINNQPQIPCIFKNKELSVNSIVDLSKMLVSVPYLWGGKSSFGYDCSGFVQSVYRIHGLNLRRDSSDMYNDLKNNTIDFSDVNTADLVFFIKNEIVEHVGIIIDQTRFIHCSGCIQINSFIKNDANYYNKIDDYKLIFTSAI